MARSRATGTVALLSAPGTLAAIDPLLRRAGVRLLRITTFSPVPTDSRRWVPRVHRAPPPDTIVATSRTGVGAGVAPWLLSGGKVRAAIEFWAVGPGTARALRSLGISGVKAPRQAGTAALGTALDRPAPRQILYFRSQTAGSTFARALRRRGHRVTEVTAYRLAPTTRISPTAHRKLARAKVWIVTSPSSLRALRDALTPSWYARHLGTAHLVVLGERSRREAAAQGFQHISVAPSATPGRFTRHLLRELRAGKA
jgi:uroporphyrinogen-III synthase